MTQHQIVTVDFHGQSILAILHDGKPHVALRPIVENIGLDWKSQHARIQRHGVLSSTVVMMTTVAEDGKQREMLCLPLTMLNGWLFGVDVNRVNPELRDKLMVYQRECFDVLARHFMPAQRPHNPAIDYDRISPAQAQDLKEIVAAIVKEGIQGYGETWARFQRKFRVNSYLELPATRHLEARAYLLGKLPKGDAGVTIEQPAPLPSFDPLNAQAMTAASKQANEYLDAAHQGQFTQPAAIPPEVLCGLLAQAMLNQRFMLSFDRDSGRMNIKPVPDDAFVLSWPQFARGVVTNDIMATNTELADLASACNHRLAQRLAA